LRPVGRLSSSIGSRAGSDRLADDLRHEWRDRLAGLLAGPEHLDERRRLRAALRAHPATTLTDEFRCARESYLTGTQREENQMSDPQVVSQDEWLAARKRLLEKEKELTRQRDAVTAERRRLPMVEIEKDYVFESAGGKVRLLDMFEGRGQLLVYHFMWLWDEDQGCPSCSFLVDNIGHLSHLHARDTTLAVVSRAPLDKGERFRQRMGWTVPWYSSFGSDFNYDFHVTIDESVAPVEYNYRDKAALEQSDPNWVGWSGEQPGVSAFLRQGDRVFHTYSGYARALDALLGTYNWLDFTARGRQEDWEEPAGRSNSTVMAWLRHHDRYGP
jgi:predicted dithiol-disulfide oxidoreductase (DUF899 family)